MTNDALIKEARSYLASPAYSSCDREYCEQDLGDACCLLRRVTDALITANAREAALRAELELINDLRNRASDALAYALLSGTNGMDTTSGSADALCLARIAT